MLKGGVIMDVMNPEQARIAERAGAVAGAEIFPLSK
jgi:pyridoxal 5'-phosphate synthase pdxS subunit